MSKPSITFHYVSSARKADGTNIVIKILFADDTQLNSEAETLKIFNSTGVVHLLNANSDGRMLLLERAEPGTPLNTVANDEEATSVAIGLIRNLWQPISSIHLIPSLLSATREYELGLIFKIRRPESQTAQMLKK